MGTLTLANPTVIETIPKRGYRLIAPVSLVTNSQMNSWPRIESLAVLPLANLMGSVADHEYYVAAMHEALIGELGQIDGLTVISRTSMTRYRNTDRPACEIARELNVDALVEGSMFKARVVPSCKYA
jgi:TolB-like protein